MWPHDPYRIKLRFIFLKSAMRHSQGSVGAPHGLKNRRASDAQSVNVRPKGGRGPKTDLRTCSQTSLGSTTTDFGPHNLCG